MGRKRTHNPLNLPPRVYAKHGAFYYFHKDGRWQRLGTDVETAKREAARITHVQGDGYGTMAYWLAEFVKTCRDRVKLGTLKPRSADDYAECSVPLSAFFGKMLPTEVQPHHVGDYLDLSLEAGRSRRGNMEKAILSACFSWLIRKGHAGVLRNPCAGIRRNPEKKRDRYVEDAEMAAVLADAPKQVWGLAHLVYRTLQRPEDIIRWTPRNIVQRRLPDGRTVRVIRNRQAKTGAEVDIEVTPEIDAILTRLAGGKVTGMTLIHRLDGKPYSYDGLCAMLKRRQKAVRQAHLDQPEHPLAKMAPWGFYDLKGKGATDMWQTGTPLSYIQVLCGHDSVTTTEIYVKTRWRGVVKPNQVAAAV